MVKNKIFNALKCSFVVALFACVGLYSTACACNELDSNKVYDNFVNFVNAEDNLFEFETKTINSQEVKTLKINIPYDKAVSKKLSYEAFGSSYRDEECDGSEFAGRTDGTNIYKEAKIVGYTEYLQNPTQDANFSDFYILKAIYEPMLEVATYQIGNNYQTLLNNAKTLNKEKANEVNEKLSKVISMTEAVRNSVTVLNNNKNAFEQTSPEYAQPIKVEGNDVYYPATNIFKYRNKQEHIYFELKNIKKNFENLIMACFDLNKSFMELHLSIRTTCDFTTVKQDVFADEEKNLTYKVILNDYLNYMLTMASYVAFSIDGGQCSFMNSRDEFSKLYANIVETGENGSAVIKNFAKRNIYQDNLLQIYNVCINKNLFNFNDDYKDTLKASYLDYVINCQSTFEAFMQQFDNFKNSIDGVDYMAYVMSDVYKDSSKTYMDYATTLKGDERTKFIIVHEFLTNYYAPLARALSDLQAEILK